jgi:SAM-dependent methyltransferase
MTLDQCSVTEAAWTRRGLPPSEGRAIGGGVADRPFSLGSAARAQTPAVSHPSLDFGYPWWLNYGHLVLFLALLAAVVAARALHASRWVVVPLLALAMWAGSVALLVYSFGINQVPQMPTQAFLQSGTGRVVDLGAGTGRSSIMVLTERPHATLVASDLFGTSFAQHFGSGERPQDRLLANLKTAGVDGRATIATADMLKLPFENDAFDGIVSAYAMDHLGRNGARAALTEAHRVLKPGGDFLLILVANDGWVKLAFGPLLSHGGTYGPAWWREAATAAGFVVREEGARPATTYFLLTR